MKALTPKQFGKTVGLFVGIDTLLNLFLLDLSKTQRTSVLLITDLVLFYGFYQYHQKQKGIKSKAEALLETTSVISFFRRAFKGGAAIVDELADYIGAEPKR